MLVHFQEWYLILSVILLLAVPWISRYLVPTVLLAIGLFAFHLWNVLPYWDLTGTSDKKDLPAQDIISVFYANVNSQNSNKQIIIDYLKLNKPDFVLLVEFNSYWAKEIKQLESIYPYAKAIPQEGNFGMAIFSKTELQVESVFVDRENMIPALFLKGFTSHGNLNLALLHAFPPIGHYGTMLRNQYLQTMSFRLNDLEGATLVCGDLNTTPWTSIYKKFVSNSGMIMNNKLLNTWPSTFLLPKIPIDHCFSKNIQIVKYEKGPEIGSDHFPLLLQIVADKKISELKN